MKIAIIQIYNEKIKKYAEYSRMINMTYAIQHNYHYLYWDHDLVPANYSVYYNKIIAMYQALKSDFNFDWVLYLDADAIITNMQINIEDIIARNQDKEIILAKDKNGCNNGVILIKNTPTMNTFLQKVYVEKQFFHTKFPEQAAMFSILATQEYVDKVGWEPMDFFNAYLCYYADMKHQEPLWNKDTSFILHLQRIKTEDRIRIFLNFLQKMNIFYIAPKDE